MIPTLHEISRSSGSTVSRTSTAPRQIKDSRFRRPNKLQETAEKYVVRAIPDNCRRPDHTRQSLDALRAHQDFVLSRADRKKGLVGCMSLLTSVADYASMTVKIAWSTIGERLGVTRRTVARYIRKLQEMKLLAVVFSGRSAKYAPKAEQVQGNEVAVYVLCLPDESSGSGPQVVDTTVTPPSEAGNYLSNKEVNPRTRARKGFSKSHEQKKLGVSVDQIRWNRHWVPETRKQQLTAAWRIKRILPNVLGRMTYRDIANCFRDFFETGWSIADIHHALDHKPDNTLWPHSGAPNTKAPHRVRGWLSYRLAAWRNADGRPMVSKAQQEHQSRENQRIIESQQKSDSQTTIDPKVKRSILSNIRSILSRKPCLR